MADLISPLTTELRISGRILRETALGLKRTGWMNAIIVVTMASILSIFGILIALIMQTGVFLSHVGSQLEISAYIAADVDPRSIKSSLLSLPHVQKITLVSKEKGWADMQKDYPMPDIENPLPDTIHLQMANERFIPETVEKLKAMPQIEEVQYPKAVLSKIRGITQGASIAGTAIIIFIGLLTLFIISNTIHLLIQAKSREIEILRMMGVGNWYIRLPFLIQGGLYGFAGALVAYIPLSITVYYINEFFNYMDNSNALGLAGHTITAGTILSLLILIGVVVGTIGSAIAILKYLDT